MLRVTHGSRWAWRKSAGPVASDSLQVEWRLSCSRSCRPEWETEAAACAVFTATPSRAQPLTRPPSETGEDACVPKQPTFQGYQIPRCRAWTWAVTPSAHRPLAVLARRSQIAQTSAWHISVSGRTGPQLRLAQVSRHCLPCSISGRNGHRRNEELLSGVGSGGFASAFVV